MRWNCLKALSLECFLLSVPQATDCDQKTPGINRQRTLAQYSLYPCRLFERNRSSSTSRNSKTGVIAATTKSPQKDPSANGVPSTSSNPPAYMGWRTTAYGPVEMTR